MRISFFSSGFERAGNKDGMDGYRRYICFSFPFRGQMMKG